ncbi:MAG: pyrroline-5-carboxylate reductase [Deltaproteobacteria bacterium]|nr:pyrroline-5-carboxylate reductase [Deltaproteobacteria bacterium]
MSDNDQRLAIVGCGTMGEAILGGLVRADRVSPGAVVVTARRAEEASRLHEQYGVEALTDNRTACAGATAALVALKPQRMGQVLDDDGMREALAGTLVISIAAGIDIATLQRWLPDSTVIRAMPNTPCLIGAGMTVLAAGEGATDEHRALARGIFESVGRCVELEDKHMDAVTSLNGSGPAFAYVILEALADGGVMMGLPRDIALEIAAQVLQGSAKMVLETGFHPAALKDQVTTPAGSTIAGLLTMEDGRIRSVLARTIQEATRVAGGLGRSD